MQLNTPAPKPLSSRLVQKLLQKCSSGFCTSKAAGDAAAAFVPGKQVLLLQ
jgi:hypothetical protein